MDGSEAVDPAASPADPLHAIQTLAGFMPAIVFTSTAGGRCDYCNQRWCAFTGLTLADSLGDGWMGAIHPEDRAQFARWWSGQAQNGQETELELRLRSADGSYRWVLICMAPLRDAAGNIRRWLGLGVDVQTQKQAEIDRAQAEHRAQALLQHSSEAIQLLDGAGRHLYSSPGVERILGYTPAELSGRGLFSTLHPEDRDRTLAAFAELVQQPGESMTRQQRIIRRDGAVRWLESTGTNLLHDPNVQAIVVNYRDVTLRLETQEALRASRDQLQTILQSVADGITVQEANGNLLYANEAATRLMGAASTEALLAAQPDTRLSPYRILDEAGQPLAADQLPGRTAFRSHKPESVVLQYERLDTGERRWSHVRAVPATSESGSVRFVVSAFQDITALKRSEMGQHFLAEAGRLLAESLDVAETLQHVLQLAVPEFADICAVHTVQADGSTRQLAVAHVDPDKAPILDELQHRFTPPPDATSGYPAALRTGRTNWIPDLEAQLSAGSRLDPEHLRLLRSLGLKSQICAPLIAHGRVLGALTFATAASGRRYHQSDLALVEALASRAALAVENARLYEELSDALAATREALSTRDRFLSMASHELRTPLAALSGYLDLVQRRLSRGVDAALLTPLLDQARAQAGSLGNLIGDLLDISRIEAGRLTIDRAPVRLGPLLDRLATFARAAEPPRSIELIVPEDLPAIPADEARLEQIFTNLLENARKYSPENTIIEVFVTLDHDTVAVAIRDSGIGIPPEDLAQLFTPFYRARNVDQRKTAGLGLGLYIAHEIAIAHNGSLTVESETGRGSTFTLRLPLSETAPEGSAVVAGA